MGLTPSHLLFPGVFPLSPKCTCRRTDAVSTELLSQSRAGWQLTTHTSVKPHIPVCNRTYLHPYPYCSCLMAVTWPRCARDSVLFLPWTQSILQGVLIPKSWRMDLELKVSARKCTRVYWQMPASSFFSADRARKFTYVCQIMHSHIHSYT